MVQKPRNMNIRKFSLSAFACFLGTRGMPRIQTSERWLPDRQTEREREREKEKREKKRKRKREKERKNGRKRERERERERERKRERRRERHNNSQESVSSSSSLVCHASIERPFHCQQSQVSPVQHGPSRCADLSPNQRHPSASRWASKSAVALVEPKPTMIVGRRASVSEQTALLLGLVGLLA